MVNKSKSCGRSEKRHRNDRSPLPLFSKDDCPMSLPAAGWRNGDTLNNDGSNGNYWSSTPNGSNSNNAQNLNFNSGNHNVDWNNRNNGHSVRPVSELTPESALPRARRFSITSERLLLDLYRAYKDARRNKRGRPYQLKFEYRLEENLAALRDELISGNYRPLPSSCFIIHDPKMREVFAANFRDRVVHHLFYNYTYELFERTFIADCYSCVKRRGTHYGIERLKHHILSESAGYSLPCYVLKIDIRGYFMNIDRGTLLEIARASLAKMRRRRSTVEGKRWGELLDYEFVDYLLERIINTDPLEKCNIIGSPSDWDGLPPEKSIFHAAKGRGLPIGNLSSQLFSNVYMNEFDQFVKRELGCRHYGRYVDDAYIVARDRGWLKSLVPRIADFLSARLGLTVNLHKVRVIDCRHGVEFLGAYLRPFRAYISHASLRRVKRKLPQVPMESGRRLRSSINSFLGVMSHYRSYHLRRVLFGTRPLLLANGGFSRDWLTYTPAARSLPIPGWNPNDPDSFWSLIR